MRFDIPLRDSGVSAPVDTDGGTGLLMCFKSSIDVVDILDIGIDAELVAGEVAVIAGEASADAGACGGGECGCGTAAFINAIICGISILLEEAKKSGNEINW